MITAWKTCASFAPTATRKRKPLQAEITSTLGDFFLLRLRNQDQPLWQALYPLCRSLPNAQGGSRTLNLKFLRLVPLPLGYLSRISRAYRAAPVRGVGVEPTSSGSRPDSLPLADPRIKEATPTKKGQASACDAWPLRRQGTKSGSQAPTTNQQTATRLTAQAANRIAFDVRIQR